MGAPANGSFRARMFHAVMPHRKEAGKRPVKGRLEAVRGNRGVVRVLSFSQSDKIYTIYDHLYHLHAYTSAQQKGGWKVIYIYVSFDRLLHLHTYISTGGEVLFI